MIVTIIGSSIIVGSLIIGIVADVIADRNKKNRELDDMAKQNDPRRKK